MKLFNHDKDNSNPDNVWVDITPVMAVANVCLLTDGTNHTVSFHLLRPLSLEDEEQGQNVISKEYELGVYDDDRELVVEVDTESLYVRVMREEIEELTIRYKNYFPKEIVVDVLKDTQLYQPLGCFTYDDLRMDAVNAPEDEAA